MVCPMPAPRKAPLPRSLQESAFVQAQLLDQFIALAREAMDGQTGFARESLLDLVDHLRDQRRTVGTALRPRLVGL